MADYVHSDGVAIAPEIAGAARARSTTAARACCGGTSPSSSKSPGAVVGLAVLVALVALAVLAPCDRAAEPLRPAQLDIMDNMLPPGEKLGSGITAFLGTDDQGRDMLSAILYGLRISLRSARSRS